MSCELDWSLTACNQISQQLTDLRAQLLLLDKVRRVRTVRGARARYGLKTQVLNLEKRLGGSFERLRRDVIASVRGQADDVISGRIHQARDQERVDRERLAAILALLALWKRRHVLIMERAVEEAFALGRRDALQQLRVQTAPRLPETNRLRAEVVDLYRDDIDRLQQALGQGSPRSQGLQQIMTDAATVATAIAAINTLFRQERFRLDLMSESAVWTAWSQGHRAGAVEGTEQRAAEDLPAPEFRWMGPADAVTCAPCLSQFGRTVTAESLNSLPLPQSICAYGRNCRHWWALVG